MKLLFARWLSAMLALCLLLSLSPAALMEGETEAQAAVVEETAPTAEGEEQAEPSEEAAEPAADDAVRQDLDGKIPFLLRNDQLRRRGDLVIQRLDAADDAGHDGLQPQHAVLHRKIYKSAHVALL